MTARGIVEFVTDPGLLGLSVSPADAAQVEHGASALLLLNRLQDSLRSDTRRPLPGLRQITPPPSEPSA